MAEENNFEEENRDIKEEDFTDTSKDNYDDNPPRSSEVTNISSKSNNRKERKLHNRRCPYCKQEYQTKIGIDNWKNLFRKPTLDDWIVLIILVLILAAAFAYTTETGACRETLSNIDQVCMQRRANVTNTNPANIVIPENMTIEVENTTIVGDIINNSNNNSSNVSG